MLKKLSSEYFGLLTIAAALLSIVVMGGQILLHKQSSREASIKTEGRNLSRFLSSLPFEQLIPENRPHSTLELINIKQINSDFAYAAVVSTNGQPLAISTTGQTPIPQVELGGENSLWATEQELTNPADGKQLLEFRSPVLQKGELSAYLRLGYFKPSLELVDLPFLAQLALPVFMMVPFIYFLMRASLKPLKEVSSEIGSIMQKQHMQPINDSAADFVDFMQNFKYFVHEVDKRFNELNQQSLQTKASSLALSYQRQRTEAALQSVPDGILVMDENGKAMFANARLVAMVGVSQEQIIGRKPHEWCRNPQIVGLLAKYQTQFQRFQRADAIDFVPEHNPEVTLNVSTYPLFSPRDAETICGTLVVFRDRTREILAERTREEFINHVSHEMKSPLNVIHMYAESLLEPDLPHDIIVNAVNVINDESERLANLINNLLNIAKIEAGSIALNLQRVKFDEFLTDTFNSVARSGKATELQFELELPRHLPSIQLDKELMRIALNNLLTNAVKYNQTNGKVALSVEERDHEFAIKISDTGIGIPKADQAHVFEKFYRANDEAAQQRGGHGLGLALAKEIIELHQGAISLESAPGQGTVFTIVLRKTSTFL